MNAQMTVFFNALGDCVAIVNKEGVVQYVNESGSTIFSAKVGVLFPDPRIVKGIRDLADGYVKPPMSVLVPTPLGSLAGCVAKLMPLPIADQYAIVSQIQTEKQFYEITLKNFYEFVRTDLTRPIDQFTQQIDFFSDGKFSPELQGLVTNGKAISERLQRIQMLAELFGTSPIVNQERLLFKTMIAEALNAENKQLKSHGIEVYLDGIDSELPPVYGSSIWLTRALRELINNAARHAIRNSRLEISLRCTGNHVILSLRNHGQFATKNLLLKKLFVPFNQVEGYINQKNSFDQKNLAESKKGPGLGLPICHQILHLHGGRITVTEGEGDEIIEFNLELATGAPVVDTQVLDAQQAHRYAHDMVALMQRMHASKAGQMAGKK